MEIGAGDTLTNTLPRYPRYLRIREFMLLISLTRIGGAIKAVCCILERFYQGSPVL